MRKISGLFKKIIAFLAVKVIERYHPIVIGVTGSVGKSTTKEAVYSVISRFKHTRKSEGNFNTDLFVPLTILGIRPQLADKSISKLPGLLWGLLRTVWLIYGPEQKSYPEVLVLELAADHPGDIELLVNICKPRIGIITAIGEVPVHVGFYPGPEAVAYEKSKLIRSLPPAGLAILNADDGIVSKMADVSRAPIMTYGLSDRASLRATDISYIISDDGRNVKGLKFTVTDGISRVELKIPLLIAPHQIYTILPAFAVGLHFGLHFVEIAEALETLTILPGRMRLIEGKNDTIILDDTYNSSPIAAASALDLLAEVGKNLHSLGRKGRKVAIIGDMKELGDFAKAAHAQIGQLAATTGDIVVAVGPEAKSVSDEAMKTLPESRVIHFPTVQEALESVPKILRKDDIVLVKGSQSMRMEKIVKAIMLRPDRASQLLCRQYGKWLKS